MKKVSKILIMFNFIMYKNISKNCQINIYIYDIKNVIFLLIKNYMKYIINIM